MMLSWGPCWLCVLLWILMMNTQSVMSKCDAGQREIRDRCTPCPLDEFKTKEDAAGKPKDACTICSTCHAGTVKISSCEKHKNTECKCLEGFTPRNAQSFVCDCGIGYGVDETGQKCLKCPYGSFSNKVDAKSPCYKWTDCGQLGVKVPGSSTSDAICNAGPIAKPNTTLPLSVTPNRSIPVVTITTAASINHYITNKVNPSKLTSGHSVRTKSTSAPLPHHGMVALGTAFVLLLILSLGLIFKFSAALCLNRLKKQIVQTDSVCRKPVEESGDKSSSSLVSSSDSSQTLEDV
ncbi:hypothetical protein ACEWY4_013181 [Coilia grayii]|uniref:TNFR-Cys domain-containing protein n=1 Tax=Coilia grayii TaxID=363190 RepID=A0ABD1JVZ8_9TELE